MGVSHKISERVRVLRARRHLSQPAFADLMGFSRNVISAVENGGRASKRFVGQLEALERKLEVAGYAEPSAPGARDRATRRVKEGSARRASAGAEIIPLRRVPLVSWAHAGEAVDYDELPASWQKAVPTDIDDPKAFAVMIAGDSMEPRYQEGDMAILNPSRPLRQNDAVIARLEDEGVVFKLCSRVGDTFRFSSYNPAYAPFEVPANRVMWIYSVHSVLKVVNK